MLVPPLPSGTRSANFLALFSTMFTVMPKIGNFLSWKWGYAARVEDVR